MFKLPKVILKLMLLGILLFNCSLVMAEVDNSRSLFKTVSIASGQFSQQKYFKILAKPILSSGEFYFDQQLGFLWQTNQPIYSASLLAKGQLYLIDHHRQKQLITGGVTIANILINAVAGDINALASDFTVIEESQIQSNSKERCLKLMPKESNLAQIFSFIRLCANTHKEISQIILFEPSGNRTEITMQLNKEQYLPEDVRVQFQ